MHNRTIIAMLKQHSTAFFIIGCSLLYIILSLIRYEQEPFIMRDGYIYLEVSRRLLSMSWGDATAPFPAMQTLPPGIFGIIATAEWLGWNGQAAIVITNLLFCSTIPLALYLTTRELFTDRRYAYFAALSGCVYPPLIRLTCMVLRDPLYWCFIIWAVFWGVRAVQHSNLKDWAWCGCFTALAILMRKEGVEVMLAGYCYLTSAWCFSDFRLKSLKHNVIALALYSTVISAWLVPINYMLYKSGSLWSAVPSTMIVEVSKKWR